MEPEQLQYGLRIEEPFLAAKGWRMIWENGEWHTVWDRTSEIGDERTVQELCRWADKGKKSLSPWKWMRARAADLDRCGRGSIRISEGPYVLMASSQASFGYLYVSLYKRAIPETVEFEFEIQRVQTTVKTISVSVDAGPGAKERAFEKARDLAGNTDFSDCPVASVEYDVMEM